MHVSFENDNIQNKKNKVSLTKATYKFSSTVPDSSKVKCWSENIRILNLFFHAKKGYYSARGRSLFSCGTDAVYGFIKISFLLDTWTKICLAGVLALDSLKNMSFFHPRNSNWIYVHQTLWIVFKLQKSCLASMQTS